MNVIDNIEDFIKDNHITKIFVDMDGVIFHSCQAIIDLLNERYSGRFNGSDVTDWNFKCCYPNMTDEEIENIFNDTRFFYIVQPIDGALEFLDKYRNKIILVTKANIENYYHKRKWLDNKKFKDIPLIALPLNVSKGYIDMTYSLKEGEHSLFIDDSVNNLRDTNSDFCIMFKEYNDRKEREWQKSWNGKVMYHW